jgi:hypothetical protein
MIQFDLVKNIKENLIEGITKGQIGTILEVYDDNHFEVEICDSNGITLFLGALSLVSLEVVV